MKPISDLKTGYWREINKKGPHTLDYDAELDVLFIFFAPAGKERLITHYIDHNVALLYRYSDREIVGMRIEDFEKGFLPSKPGSKVWKLSNAGVKLDGMCDLVFAVENVGTKGKKNLPFDSQIKAFEPVFA